MANLKDIKNRIASVKSTQQITKAMKMVSAAKFRKAEEAHRPEPALLGQDARGALEPRAAHQGGGPPAAGAARGQERGARRLHLGPGPLRLLQRQHHPQHRSVPEGEEGRLRRDLPLLGRQEGAGVLPDQERGDRGRAGGALRQGLLPRGPGHRPRDRRAVHEPRARPRLHGLQRVPVRPLPAGGLRPPAAGRARCQSGPDAATAEYLYEPGEKYMLDWVLPRYVDVRVCSAPSSRARRASTGRG